MWWPKHRHFYVPVKIRRGQERGVVVVTYQCLKPNCPRPVKEKTETV